MIVVTVTEPDANGEVFTFAEAFEPGREQPVWSSRWAGRFAASATRAAGDYKAFAVTTYDGSGQAAGVQVTSVRLSDGRSMIDRRFVGAYRNGSLKATADDTAVELETVHQGQSVRDSMPFVP